MGFLERVFNLKREDKVKNSFKKIHKNLEKQQEWIEYLHNHSQSLYEDTSIIHNKHLNHKKEIYDHINNIHSWIDFLHSNHNQLEKNLHELENNIKTQLKQEMKKYHQDLLFYFEHLLKNQDYSKIKQEILDEVEEKIEEKNNNHIIENIKYEPETKINNNIDQLTGSEKELINFLFNQDTPLTYEDIARKTGKSINTIRVYMNKLKNKRNIIDEFKKPNGVKIFSVKNKERVKTLYNI